MQIKKTTDYIFVENRPTKGDFAFVFGSKDWKGPVKTVVNLYKKGFVPLIVFSGGINKHNGINEAETMAKNAVKLGVNRKDILVENKSTNTLENVLFSKMLIDKKIGLKKTRRIIAVAKNYHARRSLMTLKKHLPEYIDLRVIPYSPSGFNKRNWHLSVKGREKVLGEAAKIKQYLKQGDLIEL